MSRFSNTKDTPIEFRTQRSQTGTHYRESGLVLWSLTVYQLLANGINRPGAMVRSVDGLSTKVLNACLQRNTKFGILERMIFNEVPPRVEYKVTEFGTKFIRILDDLEKLQAEIDNENISYLHEGL